MGTRVADGCGVQDCIVQGVPHTVHFAIPMSIVDDAVHDRVGAFRGHDIDAPIFDELAEHRERGTDVQMGRTYELPAWFNAVLWALILWGVWHWRRRS